MAFNKSSYTVGVDVGTGSVRAGVFDFAGRRVGMASRAIQMWKPQPDWAEQSSEDIWMALSCAIRQAVEESGVDPGTVTGIGFDATCSLVVIDADDLPVTVSECGDQARNIIVWMDHRAIAETEEINAVRSDVLRYVGGRLSPEMETPKLLWLKRHLPKSWTRAARFMDLADFLVYRATGVDIRSACTTVCKWTYLGHEHRWDKNYFLGAGLDDALHRIGEWIGELGERAGHLTERAAADFGLTSATAVGVGIIDAHAGGLGLLGAVWQHEKSVNPKRLESALALIGGTSSCHMAVSREPHWIEGVWGPYYGAMLPGLWLTEGGQSATGALIDYVLMNHPSYPLLVENAVVNKRTPYEEANAALELLAVRQGNSHSSLLSRNFHTLDYHLGNRTPYADPRARAVIDGGGLDSGFSDLLLQYLSAVQAVAYGTKSVVEAMNSGGHTITEIYAVGGGTRNPLWLREHADILGMRIHLPEEPESVLLGSAILGALAAGAFPSIPLAMQAMCRSWLVIEPDRSLQGYHEAKYACYQSLYRGQQERRRVMSDVNPI